VEIFACEEPGGFENLLVREKFEVW
jgi:hypothetical protein